MTQEDFEKKRSQAAIRAQAMKEMENEKKVTAVTFYKKKLHN
jgi:hypothetical protein